MYVRERWQRDGREIEGERERRETGEEGVARGVSVMVVSVGPT